MLRRWLCLGFLASIQFVQFFLYPNADKLTEHSCLGMVPIQSLFQRKKIRFIFCWYDKLDGFFLFCYNNAPPF